MNKPQSGHVWLKYRHTYSYEAAEWNWEYLGYGTTSDFKQTAKNKAFDKASDYNWSEHYRGIESELVFDVPRKVVENEIKKNKLIIKNSKEILGDMLEILELIDYDKET